MCEYIDSGENAGNPVGACWRAKRIRFLHCEKSALSEFLRSPYSVCFSFLFVLLPIFLSILSILFWNSKLDRNRLIAAPLSFERCDKSQIIISCFLWFSSLLFKRFIESVARPRFRRDDPQQLDQSEILYDSYSFESVRFHFLRNVSIVQIFIFQLLMLQVLRYTLLNFHFLLYLSFANCN